MRDRKHLILVGPEKKRAGLRNQHLLAIQMFGREFYRGNKFRGLATLTLPQTQKEIAYLEKLWEKGYRAKLVKLRPGEGQRRILREHAESSQLLVHLAELFLVDNPNSPRAESAFCREFTQWISSKLKTPSTNKIKKLLEEVHPELVNRTSRDWWQKRIKVDPVVKTEFVRI